MSWLSWLPGTPTTMFDFVGVAVPRLRLLLFSKNADLAGVLEDRFEVAVVLREQGSAAAMYELATLITASAMITSARTAVISLVRSGVRSESLWKTCRPRSSRWRQGGLGASVSTTSGPDMAATR